MTQGKVVLIGFSKKHKKETCAKLNKKGIHNILSAETEDEVSLEMADARVVAINIDKHPWLPNHMVESGHKGHFVLMANVGRSAGQLVIAGDAPIRPVGFRHAAHAINVAYRT